MTQADLNNGSINDSATATGRRRSGPAIDVAAVDGERAGDAVAGVVDREVGDCDSDAGDGGGSDGDVSLHGHEHGERGLTAVHVTDTQTPPAGGAGVGADVPVVGDSDGYVLGFVDVAGCRARSATFTATYTVTQADLNNGSINDSATATGTPPSGPDTTSPPSTASVPVTQSPALSIVKSATATPDVGDGGGSDGDVSLHGHEHGQRGADRRACDRYAEAAGGRPGVGADVPVVGESGGYVLGSVDVARTGAVGDVHATYTVTQADLDNGSINDSATATGTPPSGPDDRRRRRRRRRCR